MIAIPGGTFLMGSSLLEDGRADDEWPRRRVVIRPFWMDKTEVSWDEYNEFRKGGFVSNRTNAEALAKNVGRDHPPHAAVSRRDARLRSRGLPRHRHQSPRGN